MERITLYFRQGSSDKVYQASIEPADGGNVVQFAYGRRGSTLQTGAKTNAPVPYEEAARIFNKLVAEKTAKGYTRGDDGIPYQHTDKAALTTGVHCQLLNPVTIEEAEGYLSDPDFVMQEKHDGRRLLIRKQGGEVTGINRRGLVVALPQTLAEDAGSFPNDFIFDGEAVGDTFHAFDLLALGGADWNSKPYIERIHRLLNVLGSFQHSHMQFASTAFAPAEKREMFERLKMEGKEGVVFKHADAPYTAGRPPSGGSQLKCKFIECASFIVGKINAKRSVSLQLFNGERRVEAGNVTIPPNHEIPSAGSVVECRYLYAFRESGCIYQPVYLGSRDDIAEEECVVEQLKYKAADAEP